MDKSYPLLSIVIPHYNNFNILKECIESLLLITYKNYEIIIVDNCSEDNSYSLIKENFKNLNIYKTEKNLGYSGGCNFGAKYSKGDYILFLNNDTIHSVDFIEPLIDFLEKNQDVSSVQPKIKNYYKKKYFDYAGAAGGFIDYLVYPFCRGRIFDTLEKDNKQYDNNFKVFWTSGTAFITRKKIFDYLRGFDEKLFCHMEEIDYCWKTYLIGYKNYVIPESVIYHKGAQSLGYDSIQKKYLNHRNSMILLLTNYQLLRTIKNFIIRFFLEILSSFYELFKLRPSHFLIHYKTFIYLFFNLNYLLKRRQFIQKIRKYDDSKIINSDTVLRKSLVKDYFLLNKKYFYKVMK